MAAPARPPRALLAPLGLALLAVAAAAAATDPFSPQLGDTGGCRGQCGRSLPCRAAADAVLNACYRGCRLFSICHFVDASAELNTTRAECEAACAEAYGNAEEQFGCMTGCRKQLPEVEESRKEKSLELEEPSFSLLDLVSTFCNDIVSSAQSFISSTWTFYLQADDGKVVVFQSQPEMEYPAPEAPEVQPAQAAPGSSPRVPQPHTGSRARGEKPPMKEPRGKAKAHPPEPPQQEHDFLGCMSKWGVVGCYRRSGLPRWILAACLFLSIMVMLWLSCASLVTAPEQHVKTQPLSINGDKEYLEDLGGPSAFPLPPVIAVTLCPAHGEDAGPLPLKVDLDKTIL
ncbi:transmembrane protein 59-like isoform X1 [Myiozetetes cayanensis]|uniref:transmembrane protein 59-like isoform X1 n=1 Tax=Myiozetetes cayanensis TaxID=478635 RepID=UPI00215DDF27|nr:transmembrane protein 59-like isoform X1 [Myiozetetes cayanensis]